MINSNENKSGYALPKESLKFLGLNAAVAAGELALKPLFKNSKQVFLESCKAKNLFSNKILGSLGAADFLRLEPHLESVSLALGQSLYRPQDRIEYVYFPESAIVSNLQMLEDGRTVEVAMTGREGVTDLLSVFNSQPASNWTEVIVAGNAFRLKAQILKQEFNCNLSLQASLFDYVNSYVGQISQRVICNNYHQIKERFCSWLLMLQNRSHDYKFFLTHEQIARFLGVHRPGVSHIAHELREAGIIDYRRGQIIILNLPGLEKLTCSCFRLN